jgi:hypothetical protein
MYMCTCMDVHLTFTFHSFSMNSQDGHGPRLCCGHISMYVIMCICTFSHCFNEQPTRSPCVDLIVVICPSTYLCVHTCSHSHFDFNQTNMYVCIYTHTHIYIHIYTYIHACIQPTWSPSGDFIVVTEYTGTAINSPINASNHVIVVQVRVSYVCLSRVCLSDKFKAFILIVFIMR